MREEHLRLTAEARIETACCPCLNMLNTAYFLLCSCCIMLSEVRDKAPNMLWRLSFPR